MPGLQNVQSLVVISQQFAKADLGKDASVAFKYAWTTFCNALKGNFGLGTFDTAPGISMSWYARGPVYDFVIDLDSSVGTLNIPYKNLRSFVVVAYGQNGTTTHAIVPASSSSFTINLTSIQFPCKLTASNIEL